MVRVCRGYRLDRLGAYDGGKLNLCRAKRRARPRCRTWQSLSLFFTLNKRDNLSQYFCRIEELRESRCVLMRE